MGRAQIGGLTSAAGKQIQTWPETGRAQRAKQTVKSLIRGQKPMPADRFSWPNALLGEGLLSVWESGKRFGEKQQGRSKAQSCFPMTN